MLLNEYAQRQPQALAGGCRDDRLRPVTLALSTIGYREIAGFLRGEMSLAEAIVHAKRASRRLAKRQLTWFRADPEIVWLDASHAADEALKLFQNFFASQHAFNLASVPPPLFDMGEGKGGGAGSNK
jgi:tRNA A37 N6-isopentenylltransferase MiaA